MGLGEGEGEREGELGWQVKWEGLLMREQHMQRDGGQSASWPHDQTRVGVGHGVGA